MYTLYLYARRPIFHVFTNPMSRRSKVGLLRNQECHAAEHSAHSTNATSPAVRLTVIRIPSYACTSVTVAAVFDDSPDCKALTVTVL